MSILLVITSGQTDVQLVSEEARAEFPKDRCAALHDDLERRVDEWTIVDAPVRKSGQPISALPPSLFQICTPKLDAVLDYLSEKRLTLTHALVFDTRRNSGTTRGDPRLAGTILERHLRERIGVVVWRTTVLKDDERLEDPNHPRDAVIRRYIVSLVQDAVKQAVDKSGPDRIVVAATGGMDTLNTLVEEVIQLYAGSGIKVDLLEVADGARAHPPTRDRAVSRRSIPEPAESFRARRHALELIERGNFLGAWGAVLHLNDDEVERRWTQVIEWLYLFAASLPLGPECDIAVLKHSRMAVRAALRVELALRSGDIPRAVHGTVALFESALWDHLYSRCVQHPTNRRLFQFDPVPLEKLIRTGTGCEDDRKRPFERRIEEGDTWYRVFDDDVCAVQLAKYYLKNNDLLNLGKAVSNVRELRNDVAHNEPTPELMADAREKMVHESLWSKDDRFLTQPLVQKVLRELGETKESLCEGLIATIRSRLLADARRHPQ
jgi:hypothetical protein